MTLPLEFGSIRDPAVQRALQTIAQQFPVVSTGGGGGAPSGPAGGVLGGTYPNPSFAADMATQAELDAHTGLTTTAHGGIVASTDPRLTDARTPTAHHATHEPGGTDAMAVDAAAATGSLRTLGTTATSAAAGNDARLSDARTPSGVIAGDLAGSTWPTLNIAAGVIVDADVNAAAAIAESKLNLATDAAAGTGSRRTLGTSATSAAAGNRGLPVGGASGQVLAKNTATDYDAGWTTPAGGGSVFYDGMQPGVLLAGDCALTVNTTAQVTIAAGTVYVTASGVLARSAPGSTVLGSIPAASASNFRLDQVVVTSTGTVSRLQGTQGTTVTLDNRTGVASIPAGSMLLHDILVTATGVTTANCRDRRSRANGLYARAASATGTDFTATTTTFVDVDAALQQRVELTGAPARVTFIGRTTHTADARWIGVHLVDTVAGAAATMNNSERYITSSMVGESGILLTIVDFVPSAGSHLIKPQWATSGATASLIRATAPYPPVITVQEFLQANANNGTT